MSTFAMQGRTISRDDAKTLSFEIALRDIADAPRDGTPILALVRHPNWKYAGIADKFNWQELVVARWMEHNGGGWTWYGVLGELIGWQPLQKAVQMELAA